MVILLQKNSMPKFALALVFGGFLQRQKQTSLALLTHCYTYMQVIHIRHPLTVLEYSFHKFRCGDHEHFLLDEPACFLSMDSNLDSGL